MELGWMDLMLMQRRTDGRTKRLLKLGAERKRLRGRLAAGKRAVNFSKVFIHFLCESPSRIPFTQPGGLFADVEDTAVYKFGSIAIARGLHIQGQAHDPRTISIMHCLRRWSVELSPLVSSFLPTPLRHSNEASEIVCLSFDLARSGCRLDPAF